MKLILLKLGPMTEKEIELPWVAVGEAFKQMIRSSAVHIHKEHFDIVFKCLEVLWLLFFLLLFFYSWVTEEKICTYWGKYLCFIGPELVFFFWFGNIKYKVVGKILPFFSKFSYPGGCFVNEKGTTVGETQNSVLWLGKNGLYSLPLHTLQNPCWNAVLVLCLLW